MTQIERRTGLDADDMAAVVALRRRCEKHDRSDLKLELSDAVQARDVDSLVVRDDGAVVGFCSIDRGHDVEVCGMVDPRRRCAGIGGALLDTAIDVVRSESHASILVIAEDAFAPAIDWLHRRGGSVDSSEHRMLASLNSLDASGARAQLRRASESDSATLRRLVAEGFATGDEEHAAYHEEHDEDVWARDEVLLAYDGDTLIGTARLTEAARPMLYGFIVTREMRGRGMGRMMLRAVLARLQERGVPTVGLEVDTSNEAAMRLYTSFGFRTVTTYRYLRLLV